MLFIDIESAGIELHGGMRDCPYINILEIYSPGSYHCETDTLGAIGLFGGFAAQNRAFPIKLKNTSGTQGRKHKVPFGTSSILCQDIIFFILLLPDVVVKLANTTRIKTIEMYSHPTWTFTI